MAEYLGTFFPSAIPRKSKLSLAELVLEILTARKYFCNYMSY